MKLAARVQTVPESLTLAISAKAKAMKSSGLDVLSFSAGEPDFETPSHIKEAAKKAIDAGKTRYGPAAGEPLLREAISNALKADKGVDYLPNQVIVTNGGKHSLYNLMQALIEPGDEVLIPAPYWLSYPEMVKLAGGSVRFLETTAEQGYKITPDQLKKAIGPQTKLFIFNSPSNPTGMVYSPAEVRAIAAVLEPTDVAVVSDEIYDKILYDDAEHLSIASVSEKLRQRTFISSGFAKSYSMTGWRLGFLAGPVDCIQAMTKLQSHSTSNVCTFAQYGAIAALEGDQGCVEEMRQAFAERRKFMLARLRSITGIECPQPDGAFYMFPSIKASGLGSLDFAQRLLEDYQVATVPGVAFGDDQAIRMSYATSMKSIHQGLDRLESFMTSTVKA